MGCLLTMMFIIQGFSKQCENLCHQRYNSIFVTLICCIYGMNKMGHCEWGGSLAIFAVLALCGLCQYAFRSLLIDDVSLFSIWGNVWLFKRVVFSPVLSQREEQRVNCLRYNQKFLLHCLCFSDPEIH